MDCFPPCATCSGLCKSPEHVASPVQSQLPGMPRGRNRFAVKATRARRLAAIERELAPYMPLVCGHFTIREVVILYSDHKPKGKDTYCEVCHKWTWFAPKPPPVEYPEEPPF